MANPGTPEDIVRDLAKSDPRMSFEARPHEWLVICPLWRARRRFAEIRRERWLRRNARPVQPTWACTLETGVLGVVLVLAAPLLAVGALGVGLVVGGQRVSTLFSRRGRR